MTALADARGHLEKAKEFLEAAECSLDMELFNAATSNAVISGINSKDAICLALTGSTTKSPNHLAVDSTIWVEFEQGNAELPIWTGATWGTETPGPLSLESDGELTLRATTLTVNAAMADYSGILKSQSLITDSVIAASYTPGAGNLQ